MSKLHDVFMKTAFLFSEKSSCVSHHVGAVIVKDDRIISVGYNGTPPGLPNCSEVFDKDGFSREDHHKWSKDNEIHAEMNAIAYSAKTNVEVDGANMYVTISPCNDCLKNLIPTGIKNIFYLFPYDGAICNPTLMNKINVQEVPGAQEIKKWVELNNLIYIPRQRREDHLWDTYMRGFNEEMEGDISYNGIADELEKAAYELGRSHAVVGDDNPKFDRIPRHEILKQIKSVEK